MNAVAVLCFDFAPTSRIKTRSFSVQNFLARSAEHTLGA